MKKLAFLLLLLTTISHSQTAGSIDLTFNTNDTGYDIISGTDARVNCNKLQSDGKIIIGGNFSKYNGVSANRIARLNSDGSLDTTFNIGTGFTTTSINQGITEIVLQVDGKIIVAGTFTAYNGIACKDLVRLNSNGTLDTTFNIGTGFNNTINAISIQSDGKIIVVGAFTFFNNNTANYILKLNTDGTLDTTFDATNSGSNLFDAAIIDLAIQSDEKIMIVGNFTNYGGSPQNKVARLNPNGLLDILFNNQGTGFVGSTSSIAIQSNGKIIVGGNFTSYNGINKNHLIRLETDGTIDTTFNTGTVTGPSSAVTSVNIQSDGKIMILGSFTSYNNIIRNKIARLNSSGSLDTSFNIDTNFLEANYFYDPSDVYPSPIFNSISTLTNGKMILTGLFQTNTFSGANIKKINTNGTFDTSFNTTSATGANGPINAIAIQNDGKLIVAGGFSEFNSYLSPGIVRLNVNGTVDSSFLSNFYTKGGTVTTINDILIQPDGKILVIGGFLYVDNLYTAKSYLRLNTDGTFDDTFVITTSSNFDIRNTISLQTDGKLLIGGSAAASNPKIKRLNSDGSLDSGFITGTSFNSGVYKIQLQSDGKILVGGGFTSYNGIAKSGITRLNSNGVFDTTFAGTGATGRINAITLQNDGKILIGGAFTSYNGVAANSIIRINNDGSKDNTFITSIVANVVSINIQSDGKIIVVADISTGSIKKSKIVRLNIDGTIDNSFNSYEVLSEGSPSSSTVHNFTINTSILDANGKLLIGGDFTSYNTTGRNRLARLNAANALSTYETEINSFAIYPNPANDKFTLDFGNDMITNYTIKINNMLGQEVYSNFIDKPQFEVTKTWQGQGIYFVKIYNENKNLVGTKKIIIQ